jgi:hypothetical protein
MKHQHLITLAAALLLASGLAHAQTNIDYNAANVPVSQKISGALDNLANPETNVSEATSAALFLLKKENENSLGPIGKAVKEASPGLVDAAIADPTFGGRVDSPEILGLALTRKALDKPTLAAQVDALRDALARTDLPLPSRNTLKVAFANRANELSIKLERVGDTAGAEAVLVAAVALKPDSLIKRLAEVKVANGSADALVTALRAWQVADFYRKAEATRIVASALEIEPGQGVDAGAAFIAWVNTGIGTNPVAKVKIPKLVVEGGEGKDEIVRLILAGEPDAALVLARRILAKAPSQNARNSAGETVLGILANAKWTTAVEADAKGIFGQNWTFTAPTPAPSK